MFEIRREIREQDLPGIRSINERAFTESGGSGSYEHVRYKDDALSLVAVRADRVIGHILFTPTRLVSSGGDVNGMGLLLLAVDPDFQRQGVGQALTYQGIDTLKAKACPFIIVIGRADYYPRFGFLRGSTLGLRCQWDGVGDESFMALILDDSVMAGKQGIARYVDEFA